MRMWIVTLCVLLNAASAFAQSYPDVCKCPASVKERLSTKFRLVTAGNVQVCSKNNLAGCSSNVEVTTEGGVCTATLPYCVLCVRAKDASPAPSYPKVKWELTVGGTPTNDFKFDQIKGIEIPKAGYGGKDHFNSPGHDGGGGRKFKWQTGKDYSSPLDHWPVVYRRSDGAECKWADPIIINTDQ